MYIMETKYLLLFTIPILLIIFVVITLITLLTPDEQQPKLGFNEIKDKIVDSKLNLALFIFSIAFIGILIFHYIISPLEDPKSFAEGVLTETVGMLFDILILLVFISYIEQKAEKKRRIERYKEELNDYKGWNEKEAVYRVVGIVRRLQKEKEYNLDLSGYYLNSASLQKLNLSDSFFRDSYLKGAFIEDCNFNNSSILESNLKEIYITHSDFSNSSIIHSELQKSNIRYSKFSNLDFAGSNLSNSNFSDSNFEHAEFINCNLGKTKFRNANLKGANFATASLIEADFTRANLEEADLSMAFFQNTILTDAKLLGAKVLSVDFFEKLLDSNTQGIDVLYSAYMVNPIQLEYPIQKPDELFPSMNDKLSGYYYKIEKNPDYPNFDDWYNKRYENTDLPF